MDCFEYNKEFGFNNIVDMGFNKILKFRLYDYFNILKQLISNG